MSEAKKKCPMCQKELKGKANKQYCNSKCRFAAWNLRNPRNKIWDPNYQQYRKDMGPK